MKKSIAVLLIFSVFASATFAGCSNLFTKKEETTKETSTTTTEPTTVTTTEDTATTFPEDSTGVVFPALSKDDSTDYKYEIATYKTYFSASNKTRTQNLEVATDALNGIVIPEGETFSFNQNVGKRTVINGYASAYVVKDGTFVDGLGGGVCQVSSTVFESALRANLSIKERRCHSVKISYVALGGDATVQWGSQDFQFKNDHDFPIKMEMTCKNGVLTCSFYAKEKEDIGKVNINISKGKGDKYTLTRTVDGKQNYKTTSSYKEAQTTKKN